MNCAQYRNLIHALIDDELDAGHAAEVEAHLATCDSCTAELEALRAMRAAMADDDDSDERDRARRFRDAALPHLDDVYTLAR